MRISLKKIVILIPVFIISLVYLREQYQETYSNASSKRVFGFFISVLVLYLLFIIITIRRKQEGLFQGAVLSSFFVYVFFVLQLTGYFILFKEISSHDWWDKMNHRIATEDHVNLTAFKTIGIYNIWDKQIAGNFVMLFPLGIYLPLLYRSLRKLGSFFLVTLISLLISVEIELLQLVTSYRSADVDDVILNTLGASTGFLIYRIFKSIIQGSGKTK